MFVLATLVGIFAYSIFALGLAGLLRARGLLWMTFEFMVIAVFFLRRRITRPIWSKKAWGLVALLGVAILVNLIGALGPELGFDALWYHLTIPKIWLRELQIFYISVGDYYYSVMPKLIDITFIPLLHVFGESGAKVFHLLLGVGTLVGIYKLARKWLSVEYSLLAAAIWYGNLVVGWQSITAYIDLGRTFFEILALYYLTEKQTFKSAVLLGLAISTKLLAAGSLPIFVVLLLVQRVSIHKILGFVVISLLVASPWFVFAWVNTGNPIYPIFSGLEVPSVRHLWDVVTIFLRSPDPLSPVYLLVLPLAILVYKKLPQELLLYCGLSLAVWWLLPRTGGGRFVMPYLPVFSVVAAIAVYYVKDTWLRRGAIALILAVSLISIGYRFMANQKFLPVIFGQQTKQDFLDKHLNHDFGKNWFYLDDPLRMQ